LCKRPADSYSDQICWARCEFFDFTHALRRKSRLVRETLSLSSLTAWRSTIPRSKFVISISHIWQKTFEKPFKQVSKVTMEAERKGNM
jgi:hypothetical protein